MERLALRSLSLVVVLLPGCEGADEDKGTAPKVADDTPANSKPVAEPTKVEAKVEEPKREPEATPPKPPEPELLGEDIELPKKPTFPKTTAPLRYPDGAWSVHGLRDGLEANVADGMAGKEVVLRATVLEVYVPPTCPAAGTCPPAKQPHVWVVDSPTDKGKRRAMMVVAYAFQIPEWDAKRWASEPDVVLEEGKEYRFRGLFKQFSDTGFASDEGLLQFRSLETIGTDGKTTLVFPRGAPWHPLEVQRTEEANAALMEKARAAAVRP